MVRIHHLRVNNLFLHEFETSINHEFETSIIPWSVFIFFELGWALVSKRETLIVIILRFTISRMKEIHVSVKQYTFICLMNIGIALTL